MRSELEIEMAKSPNGSAGDQPEPDRQRPSFAPPLTDAPSDHACPLIISAGSSKDNKCRILLRWRGRLCRFLSLKFDDGPAGDGSLYIVLDREGRVRWNPAADAVPSPKNLEGMAPLSRLKLSYHATGQIHIKGLSGGREARRYGEPTFGISAPLLLFIESIPGPGALDLFDLPVTANDFVVNVPAGHDGRLSFGISMLPDRDADDLPGALAVVRYAGWFRVGLQRILPDPPTQPGADTAITTIIPQNSLFSARVISEQAALIFFHQKSTGTKGLIFYWNPNTKRFRVIFSVPMRVAPRISIEFADRSLRERFVSCSETDVCFEVFGRSGKVSAPPVILSLTADAEL
jgi:hypothetical protein